MIKQTLTFLSPVSLSLKDNQIVIYIKDSDTKVTRPIEEIGVVIVENQMTRMTVPLLNALADNNVAVVFCDGNAMPKSILMTLDGNATLQETYRYQTDASLPVKKKAWKQIVESKIRNQSTLLDKFGRNGKILKQYYMNVKSGDSDNREGASAKVYWDLLFDKSFHRERNGMPPIIY